MFATPRSRKITKACSRHWGRSTPRWISRDCLRCTSKRWRRRRWCRPSTVPPRSSWRSIRSPLIARPPRGADPQPGPAARPARGLGQRKERRGGCHVNPGCRRGGQRPTGGHGRDPPPRSAGSEVVCIIRDRNNPQSKNEIITLDRDSPAAANQSSHAGSRRTFRLPWKCPSGPRPILEWDAETGLGGIRGHCRRSWRQPSSVQPGRYFRRSRSLASGQFVTRPSAPSYSIFLPTR